MTRRHAFAKLSAAALAGAFLATPASAADPEVNEMTRLTKPQSTITLGGAYQSSDAPLAGMYNGRNEDGGYLLGDLDIVRRYDETGTWVKLRGSNLGFDSRELRFEHERQGNWGYSIEYSEIPRHEAYTVTTGLTGIGTTTQTVGGSALRPVDLDTERKRLTMELKKYLPAHFDLKIKFRNEKRDGARMFGEQGFNFLTEPVDSTTNQVDAVLSYVGKSLQVSAGYFGSFYDQHDNRIDNAAGTFTPISQPPGNQAHQIYLTGGYSFTRSTRGTFKVKYARFTQDETFVDVAANGRTNADAAMDVFSAQLGATSRPTSKLSLLGNVSYENRDERTPVDVYITGVSGSSRHNGENTPQSHETATGKGEASYRLPQGFRLTGGVDYNLRMRSLPPVRSVTYRKKNDEVTYRAELQRSLSETINGRLSFARSNRDGSTHIINLRNDGTLSTASSGNPGNVVNPVHQADRDRNKARLMLDWAPTDELSVQLMTWYASDRYELGPLLRFPEIPTGGNQPYGLASGHARAIALDAAYLLSDQLTATAWYSHENTKVQGNNERNATNTRTYALENTTHAFGAGLEGTFDNGIKAGVDLSYSFDRGEFTQEAITGAAIADIDNVYYRNARLKLFAKYDIRSNVGVRVDFIHDRWSRDDWQWENFVYADGGTVDQSRTQVDNFFGVSAYYKFW